MSDFFWRAQNFINKQEELHQNDFRINRNITMCGYEFPMRVSFRNDDKRRMFGISSAPGAKSLCAEYCFFDVCEELTEAKLTAYFQLTDIIRDELTEYDAPGHQYTMIGMVIGADNGAKQLKKQLRKMCKVKRYTDEGTGWSELRICVVDLKTGEIFCNKDGETLKRRLTVGVERRKPGFFARWLGMDEDD